MSTKHSPTIRVHAAQVELTRARDACPHWDYESGEGYAECCYRVDDAKRELRNARKAMEKSQS